MQNQSWWQKKKTVCTTSMTISMGGTMIEGWDRVSLASQGKDAQATAECIHSPWSSPWSLFCSQN